MLRTPAVSVVVWKRTAAAEATVAAARASAAHSGIEVEMIVVSGASDTPAVASRVDRMLEVFPLGRAYARNRALAAASAPIIAFLDEGMIVEGDWVRAVVTAFEAAPRPGAAIGVASYGRSRRRGSRALRRLEIPWAIGALDNVAFDRSALIETRGFDRVGDAGTLDPVLTDAADALLRLARAGYPVVRDGSMKAATSAGGVGRLGAADALRAGQSMRRSRSLGVGMRCLSLVPPRAALRAARNLVRGASSPGDNGISPLGLLSRMPDGISRRVAEGPVVPLGASHQAKTHFLYRAGTQEILHLYVNPSSRLRRGLAEREHIRRRATVDGIPKLRDVAETADALWLIEDIVPGRPPPRHAVRQWFPSVADWAVEMAGPPGRHLERSPAWQQHRADAVELARLCGLGSVVGRAFDLVSDVPARHLHGDFQRKNVHVDGAAVGAIDWEGAWLEGLPGLDLVFLALLARDDAPDPSLIPLVSRGEDPHWAPLSSRLARVGLTSALVPALIVMLATWALGEDRRRSRLGAAPTKPVWSPLFRRHATDLAPRL